MEGAREPPYRRLVEMVVVIVRDEHDVDRRQVLEGDTGWRKALHPHRAGERAQPLAPHGVGENVHAVELYEKRGVTDPRHGRLVAILAQRLHVGPDGGQGRELVRAARDGGKAQEVEAYAGPVRGTPELGIQIPEGPVLARGVGQSLPEMSALGVGQGSDRRRRHQEGGQDHEGPEQTRSHTHAPLQEEDPPRVAGKKITGCRGDPVADGGENRGKDAGMRISIDRVDRDSMARALRRASACEADGRCALSSWRCPVWPSSLLRWPAPRPWKCGSSRASREASSCCDRPRARRWLRAT